MTERTRLAVARQTQLLRQRLRRHKLVFLQFGSVFDPLRVQLLSEVGGRVVSAVSLARGSGCDEESVGPLVVSDVEVFAPSGEFDGVTLGQLRQAVDERLDEGMEVCLLSRAPRASYFAVPGSSVIEDASILCLPLLEDGECLDEYVALPGHNLPAVGLQGETDLQGIFRDALDELGVSVLAALDHALFESAERKGFLTLLDAREIEALRGCGLVEVNGSAPAFTIPQRLTEFTDATADALAAVVEPQPELASISNGLWFIERTIRKHLRDAAGAKFGSKWRRQVLHGDLPSKALERARSDVNATADSVAGLRDPIEWLSLGELLEVVQSKTFNGLYFDEVSWRRFAQDILPIRNRLSHMRLVKKGDRETVVMWVARVKSKFR